MDYRVATYAERPDLMEAASDVNPQVWPEFMQNGAVSNRLWSCLRRFFPEYQFMLFDEDERILAACNSIPIVWDGTIDGLSDEGWDWAFQLGVELFEQRKPPNALCAINIAILPDLRGQGISQRAVKAMGEIGARHGFQDLVAPVRPNHKHLYPLTPIERYMAWTQENGSPFDPWIRVHWRAGATIVKACPRSMLIEGTVAAWETWMGMKFPDSGHYVIPFALVPIEIDRERDVGRYVEPNVWMHHRIG
jgi:hypothetical protein